MNENEEYFEALYKEYSGRVLAYARRRTSSDEAQEVVAQTFLVVWRRLKEVPEDPLPWLYQVARRSLANRRRSARRRSALGDRAAAQPLQYQTGLEESVLARSHIESALSQLRPKDQEVLRLVAWEELSSREAAKVMGCSEGAFTVRLHRARKRLLEISSRAEATYRNSVQDVAPSSEG